MASNTHSRLTKVASHLRSADTMTRPFSRVVRFVSDEDIGSYFHDLGDADRKVPSKGDVLKAYANFDDLLAQRNFTNKTFSQLLAPVPYSTDLPVYCVGVNYRNHAQEAKIQVPKYPMLWIKPAAALASPNEVIEINEFCASSYPDYEGEFAFVTARKCRDLSPEEATDHILGYTITNDVSCRLHQSPDIGGGQYFFAKGFDQFAPVGPMLVHPSLVKEAVLTTRVNGKVVQSANCFDEFIWSPAQILSHMSQGTTIPAGTVVATGTPGGVGIFQQPPSALKDGDVVEIEISGLGKLENSIRYK